MADNFYTGVGDNNAVLDRVIKSGDMYVQKFEYISVNNATLDISTPAVATLTLNDDNTFVADEFNSTAAYNLLIVDDNNKVAKAKIVDCALSSTDYVITFDSTACILEEDELTPATFTNGGTYQIEILTGDNTNEYGKFWGFINGNSLENGENYAEYKYGIPQTLKFKDLIERTFSLSGGTLEVANEDVFKALMNSVSYGSQSGKWKQAVGFNPAARSYYRLAIVGSDGNNRIFKTVFRKGQFMVSGAIDYYSTDYKVIPYSFTLFSDGFYPQDADAFTVERIG